MVEETGVPGGNHRPAASNVIKDLCSTVYVDLWCYHGRYTEYDIVDVLISCILPWGTDPGDSKCTLDLHRIQRRGHLINCMPLEVLGRCSLFRKCQDIYVVGIAVLSFMYTYTIHNPTFVPMILHEYLDLLLVVIKQIDFSNTDKTYLWLPLQTSCSVQLVYPRSQLLGYIWLPHQTSSQVLG